MLQTAISINKRRNCNSCQVPGGGPAALPVLCSIHPGPEAQAFCVGKLVPSNLRQVIREGCSGSWLSLHYPLQNERVFCLLSTPLKSHCSGIDYTCLSRVTPWSGHVKLAEHAPEILRSTARWRFVYSPSYTSLSFFFTVVVFIFSTCHIEC